jgi:hypothetical protein
MPATTYRILPTGSAVRCRGRATMHDVKAESTTGVSGQAVVDVAAGRIESLEVAVDVNTLTNHDRLQDPLMRRHLEAATAGPARFQLGAPVAGSLPGRIGLAGEMTYRGRRRSLAVDADVTLDGARLVGKTRFGVRFTDFGLDPPKLLFLKVKDDVELELELVAEPAL